MLAAFDKWTVGLLDALPESSERFELIDGELFVTPSPGLAHQRAVLHLARALFDYSAQIGGFETVLSPSDVWREPREENRVQPDVYVVRLVDGKAPAYPFHIRELAIAIEVASPGRPLLDYEVKRRVYLREGVAEYWVVGLEARTVTRWRSLAEAGDVVTGHIVWQPNAAAEPFTFELGTFFDGVWR
jgi:Uma2 family endonuclease